MLGWDITVSRPVTALVGPDDPRVVNYRRWGYPDGNLPSVTLRSWSARLGGLTWLDALCASGDATLVAANGGYPMVYVARAHAVLAIIDEPPACRWASPTVIEAVESTSPQAWLVIVATDQS